MTIDHNFTHPNTSITNDAFNTYVDAWTDECDLTRSKDRRHLGDLLIEALRRNDQDSIRTIASALVIA